MRLISSKQMFWLGMVVFLLAKLYLILPVTTALVTPRQGDDSLVYLWKGQLLFSNNQGQALRDIEKQRQLLGEGIDHEVAWMRSNVIQRTQGHVTPTHSTLSAVALKLIPNLRWAYAVTELAGLVLMAAGFGWLLLEIVGPAAAGLAMVSLAFAALPNQGIHSFIPSTIAISCVLILWAYLWRRGERASPIVTGFVAFLILGIHPIAKAYVLLTPIIYWIRLNSWSAWRSRNLLYIASTCGLAILLFMLLPLLVPSLRPPPSEIMGGMSFGDGISKNLDAVLGLVWDPIIRFNLPWMLMLSGVILSSPRSLYVYPFGILIVGLSLLLGSSLLFWLPGYPGELFSRFWVLFVLLTSGIGASFVLEHWNKTGHGWRLLKWLFVMSLVLSSLFWVLKYVPSKMNERTEVINESLVASEISSFPADDVLLYAETNVALQAALLLGADRLGAIAYPVLAGTPDLDALIQKRSPAAIILPPEPRLNSLAQARYKWFLKRRQGLFSGVISHFTISRNQGMPFGDLRLLVEGDAEPMHWEATDATGQTIARGKTPWPSGPTWIALDISETAEAVHFTLPNASGWVLGISEGIPKHKVYWPWETGWAMTYGIRGKSPDKNVRLEFSVRALLDAIDADELKPYVDPQHPVQSDASGLIFLRTRYEEH
jgi:hypothetical protein